MSTTITKHGYSDHNDEDGNWHVYPEADTKSHILDKNHDCHCEPRVLLDVERRIFVHAAYDGRE